MRIGEWTLFVGLVIAGAYFLLFHEDPLPLNHEAVGLGNLHFLHDITAVAMFGIAGILLWRSRRASKGARSA